jgi:hypothetical protein
VSLQDEIERMKLQLARIKQGLACLDETLERLCEQAEQAKGAK